MRGKVMLIVVAAFALFGCGEREQAAVGAAGHEGAAAEPARQPGPEPMEVALYFTRDEQPQAVSRRVPRTDAVLRAALEALLAGPTPAEEAAGYRSFFSPATAGMLRGVRLDGSGRAVVDLADLSGIIPNASTSAGSAMLLGELDSTVFQFPEVRSVEYRLEGSCDRFWNWLQRGCQVVERP